MTRRSKSSHAEQSSTITSASPILEQINWLIRKNALALAAGTVILGGVFYCGSISARLNNQISTSNSDRMKKMAATREVLAVEREVSAVEEVQEREIFAVGREVFAVEKKILEHKLQLERDLRLKDKELANIKIYGLALFVPFVGASCAVYTFCFGKT